MQDTTKACRDHALKCSRLAESFPEGSARQLFAEMAVTWTRRAIAVEKSAPALDQWVALPGAKNGQKDL